MNKQDQGQLIRKIEKQHDVLEDYSGKWRNFVFLKNGEVTLGSCLWNSPEEALRVYEEWLVEPGTWFFPDDLGRAVSMDEVSHALQLPVKS